MHFAKKHPLKALILLGAFGLVYMKAPRFISPPMKIYTVKEGSKVKLKCQVTGTNDPSHNITLTAWRKEGIPSLRNSIIRKSRYWERFKVKNGEFLRIRNVKKQDEGLYWCIAKNPHGMLKAGIRLQVLSAPTTNRSQYVATVFHTQNPEPTASFKAPRFHEKEAVHAIQRGEGKLLRLPCHASGVPRPKIKWRKNYKNFIKPTKRRRRRKRKRGWTLTIRRLKTSDSGVYQCIVWNKHGNATKTFYVQVIGKDLQDHPRAPFSSKPEKPKPVIQKHLLKNSTALEGQTVSFSCTAYSSEVPKFTWLKWSTLNNQTVKVIVLNSSTPNVQFVRSKVSRKTGEKMNHSHKLKLLNISKADQGQYTCVVASTGGIVSAHVFLSVNLKRQTNPKEEAKRKSTAAPANSLDDNPIPLAALIAVPAALVTLLIVAMVWCYLQIVMHRKQLQAKTTMYRPNETTLNSVPCESGHRLEIGNVHQVKLQPVYPSELTGVTKNLESQRSLPEISLQPRPDLAAEANANNVPQTTLCNGHSHDLTTDYCHQNQIHINDTRTLDTSLFDQDLGRTYSPCHETRTSDASSVNYESQDNAHHIDKYGVKNSDV